MQPSSRYFRLFCMKPVGDEFAYCRHREPFAIDLPIELGRVSRDGTRSKLTLSNLLILRCNLDGFFAIRVSRRFSTLLTVDVSVTREPIFAPQFTRQTYRAGNTSGNIQKNPPTYVNSSNPLFKPFTDVCGALWTCLGITGVRRPSTPGALTEGSLSANSRCQICDAGVALRKFVSSPEPSRPWW
jgi:hypothetical protein